MSETPALEASGLGRRYGAKWALRECTLTIPRGCVTALVGPNGAGKSTLLHLAVGLSEPTTGTVSVLGRSPQSESASLLPHLGFVAQEHPLYRSFTIADLLRMGRRLNPRWDDELARGRLDRLGLTLDRKAGSLSGGEQAQVALTLALAKRPELLLLDEPVASLDPLARHEFLQALMESVADGGITVVLSSHILADLERVCDHLIILAAAHVQIAGAIDDVVRSHRILIGPRCEPTAVSRVHAVLHESHTERQTTLLVRTNGHLFDASWQQHEPSLEEIVLAYLGQRTAEPREQVAS
jgi:ABC-2 type transport system ATP-binding protein